MTKKDYQVFADAVSQIDDGIKRGDIIGFLNEVFYQDNNRFDSDRFIDWVDRRRAGQSMKGTKYNPKYMPLGIK